jgi:hypothetical protein
MKMPLSGRGGPRPCRASPVVRLDATEGILVITGRGRSICGSPQVTDATLAGQNGKAVYPSLRMGTPRGSVKHHKRKHGKSRATAC